MMKENCNLSKAVRVGVLGSSLLTLALTAPVSFAQNTNNSNTATTTTTNTTRTEAREDRRDDDRDWGWLGLLGLAGLLGLMPRKRTAVVRETHEVRERDDRAPNTNRR